MKIRHFSNNTKNGIRKLRLKHAQNKTSSIKPKLFIKKLESRIDIFGSIAKLQLVFYKNMN